MEKAIAGVQFLSTGGSRIASTTDVAQATERKQPCTFGQGTLFFAGNGFRRMSRHIVIAGFPLNQLQLFLQARNPQWHQRCIPQVRASRPHVIPTPKHTRQKLFSLRARPIT